MLRLATAVSLAIAALLPANALALEQPDCPSLERWANEHDPDRKISLAPKVEIDAFLRDELAVPLFGSPVTQWQSPDFNVVKKQLNDCRRAAIKRKDTETGDRLYAALKSVGNALRPMNDVAQFRASASQIVGWLVDYHRIPELGQILALGRQALGGEDVEPALSQLSHRRQLVQHVRSLGQARDYLPPDQVAPLVAQLADGESAVAAEMELREAEIAALNQALDAVPIAPEGAAMLDQLARSPVLQEMPEDEALAFQTAVMQKRRAVQMAMQQAAAQQTDAAAAQPIPIAERLAEILVGGGVGDVSVRGLRPGLDYEGAKKRMKQEWGFGSGMGGDLFKQFAPTGRDLNRYRETERRDGGMFVIETMDGRIGDLRFTEHYHGRLDGGAIRSWLIERFGEPVQDRSAGDSVNLRWAEGGSYLQVEAGNRPLEMLRGSMGFTSAITLNIWSREYEEFVSAAERRCHELMNTPASELSIQDKMDLLSGCRS